VRLLRHNLTNDKLLRLGKVVTVKNNATLHYTARHHCNGYARSQPPSVLLITQNGHQRVKLAIKASQSDYHDQ